MPWRGGGAAGCSQGQSERSLFSYLITVQAWRTAESVFLFLILFLNSDYCGLWLPEGTPSCDGRLRRSSGGATWPTCGRKSCGPSARALHVMREERMDGDDAASDWHCCEHFWRAYATARDSAWRLGGAYLIWKCIDERKAAELSISMVKLEHIVCIMAAMANDTLVVVRAGSSGSIGAAPGVGDCFEHGGNREFGWWPQAFSTRLQASRHVCGADIQMIGSISPGGSSSGQIGTLVTISGSILLGVSNGASIQQQVTLGGVDAVVVNSTQSQILVVAGRNGRPWTRRCCGDSGQWCRGDSDSGWDLCADTLVVVRAGSSGL